MPVGGGSGSCSYATSVLLSTATRSSTRIGIRRRSAADAVLAAATADRSIAPGAILPFALLSALATEPFLLLRPLLALGAGS
jgi:hypothetical protein